jgi:hypothetical protein
VTSHTLTNLARGLAASAFAALVLLGPAPAHAQDAFAITGEVDGLYPGADLTLDVRITNPQPFWIRVTSVAVRARDAGPGCPASMLDLRDSQAAVNIPPGATGRLPLGIRMDPGAPDACQGASWTLEFTGSAVAAGANGLPSTSMSAARDVGVLVASVALFAVVGLLAGLRRRKRMT